MVRYGCGKAVEDPWDRRAECGGACDAQGRGDTRSVVTQAGRAPLLTVVHTGLKVALASLPHEHFAQNTPDAEWLVEVGRRA